MRLESYSFAKPAVLRRTGGVTIIGSSGSGKTTLLRCLNFLERPDGGQIAVNGQTIFDAGASEEVFDRPRSARLIGFPGKIHG